MKIIFDSRVLTHKNYTGVENYAKNILENIKDKCNLMVAKPKSSNKYISHLWTHFRLPFFNGDIIFCPANIAPLFVQKNKKLILTIHDVAFQTHPDSFSRFFSLYYKLIIPININRADKIITVSNYSKESIEKYYPQAKGKIEVIYLGIDKKFKRNDVINKKDQILYVGSMNTRKNLVGVLKAFEMINDKRYKLLIVGNFSSNFFVDDKTQDLINKAKKNDNIEFKSNISDIELVEIYNESVLFLFPSFYEGFGLPVLESMACGTPVVCSDKSSLPEVGGADVVYCNPYSVEDIKDKIELVLDDKILQNEMIEKGLDRMKKFSWNKSANAHITVFEEAIK